jgi:Contractile injection system tube protein/LysM domain
MPNSNRAKAQLVELDEQLDKDLSGGKSVSVQFNPESLKLTFANAIQNDATSNTGGSPGAGGGGASDQSQGTQGRQFVGAGTTKLAVQLWFDASTSSDGVKDVRKMTQEVIYFITPKKAKDDASKFLPPGVRFSWGTFVFKGLIDGIEETIDFFSPDGHPLRASVSLTLSQQTILVSDFKGRASGLGLPGPLAGTLPLTPAAAGSTLQGLAAAAGTGDWQSLASANGIDNPRRLVPGQLLDLTARSLRTNL